ncbi:MAG: hypothetical protein A2654_00075 [Candidatus Nealsonbacteria bacterium RIFCSPHIGHO2_01_FULL_43_31]|uniref:GH10 domain-containing protein n=2 Tax=Candidatus Nealsoniibacteriota TaxID=1817911 RepID=A0A1G2E7N7_9BACT|nr:MAG: hypothetical protein A2654_00075 [Candidatus Nealsonbacteria bacterium RIFCSPHIGHO2_01_FULL_43_31]OGZ21360.1 MAG: hypothetical protein A3D46_00870 [Candidatus Nealsonbacteria bacterium RIFCSPHIGHO2_02_FULL_43_13]OGZ25573.1 MAG: hypothetical protein A2922_01315 [Candidatus Nealsonbacteria bacterium RIFCSPLOWO2_01_FULL_43_36]
MKKNIKKILLGLAVLFLILVGYFFIGSAPRAEKIAWGVNFSQRHAEYLGLDWQKTYLALIDDLGAKKIKITSQWDLIEPQERKYNFNDLDWQIRIAEEKGASVFLVMGIKTGRWPECRIPDWAQGLKKSEQQEKVLNLLKEIVLRYRDSENIWAWQVENEPFFPFGECPWTDKEFLKKEIALAKSLDASRPVIVSDTGEFSFWITAAKLGDIVSTTLHRRVWFKEIRTYFAYPLKPVFYWRKSQIIKNFFNKEVIGGELQSEPWCEQGIRDCSLEEQGKTMNLQFFQENIEFARSTGLDTFYLWGAEWWYWLKETKANPEIWNEAKKLFK